MIPAAVDYTRATSVADALQALAAGEGTRVMAGGQSLVPLLRFRLFDATKLVDIAGLTELAGIEKDGDDVRIGAVTTYRELLDSDLLRESHPVIPEVTEHIGDIQIRNAGTIGGGLAQADPASDMPAVMLVLDAKFTLRSQAGERSVAAADFFQGSFTTALKDDELLTEIRLPALPDGAGTCYLSFDQAASGYALVGAAAVVATSGGKVTSARLAFSGLSETSFLAEAASQLVGTDASADVIKKVAVTAVDGVEANEDIHASAVYRTHLATVAAQRALTLAASRAG